MLAMFRFYFTVRRAMILLNNPPFTAMLKRELEHLNPGLVQARERRVRRARELLSQLEARDLSLYMEPSAFTSTRVFISMAELAIIADEKSWYTQVRTIRDDTDPPVSHDPLTLDPEVYG